MISALSYLFSLFFGPEDGGSTFLRHVSKLLPEIKSSHSTRLCSSGKNKFGKYHSTFLCTCYAFTEM
jgi:hypothetical protein